ncbi:mechanosensitive ion channel family protein [Luteimonas abyssi]|jgi:small-conductance mechanosensitive channel|uniref:mechanosensitive ion channel family protein n=1 Tax=Luteimonas abyssi TaxID=1247514 RepID=UPI000737C20E|nr:mechanosensitive ion channel family protein [Luteimonas abyssi]
MRDRLPPWFQEWFGIVVPLAQALLIVLLAWILVRVVRRVSARICDRYELPREIATGTRRIASFAIYAAATLLILERMGVSGTVLWTAFTGFAAVAAVAFFAAWSVLSNIFCTILIFTTRPFRLHDYIEILENGEKPGLRGYVADIHLVYTTLHETGDGTRGTILQVPNNMFFQRTVRRWRGDDVPPPPVLPGAQRAPGGDVQRS